jgi:hypothetical protein
MSDVFMVLEKVMQFLGFVVSYVGLLVGSVFASSFGAEFFLEGEDRLTRWVGAALMVAGLVGLVFVIGLTVAAGVTQLLKFL